MVEEGGRMEEREGRLGRERARRREAWWRRLRWRMGSSVRGRRR